MVMPVSLALFAALLIYSGLQEQSVTDSLRQLLGRPSKGNKSPLFNDLAAQTAATGAGAGVAPGGVSPFSPSLPNSSRSGLRGFVTQIAASQVGASGYTYSETRPMPHQLPGVTDCSGFVTLVYKAAGAPDPNGNNYNGYGYTGTLKQHGKSTRSPQPGDLCFWSGPDHVAIYMGGDKCVGFGAPPAPISDSISAESKYHRSFAGFRSYL